MKTVETILQSIEEYLVSISRDTVNGWYVLEIGIPNTWVFNQNEEIGVEILSEEENGKFLKISPKNSKIVIDDLITFVEVIIITNNKITEKEKEFTEKMKEWKGVLEKEATKFYKELDDLKEKSFNKINENFIKTLNNKDVGNVKVRKPREKKIINNISNDSSNNVVKV